jgi:hypothetical protein
VLEVTARALASLAAEANSEREAAQKLFELISKGDEDEALAALRKGRWHDGRLDALAGNGAMAEVGVGIENQQDWWYVFESRSFSQVGWSPPLIRFRARLISGPRSANTARDLSEIGHVDTAKMIEVSNLPVIVLRGSVLVLLRKKG